MHGEVLEKFYEWLVSKDALFSFLSNVEDQNSREFNPDLSPDDFIRGSFYWADTKEGYDYWSNLNEEWNEIIHSYTSVISLQEILNYLNKNSSLWED